MISENNSEIAISFEQKQRDELATVWSLLVDRVVHDLTTPLVCVQSSGDDLREVLPHLIKGYRLALENKLMQPVIHEKVLNFVEKELSLDLYEMASAMLDLLSNLHPSNQKLLSDAEEIQIFSAKNFVSNILEQYPFRDPEERKLIYTDFNYDFQFKGTQFFMHNLFSRLFDDIYVRRVNFHENEKIPSLKNRDEISICFLEERFHNVIIFTDSAYGMSENAISTKKKSFFLQREGNILPDLGYCRLALLQLGGNLLFNSTESTTEIAILFPK